MVEEKTRATLRAGMKVGGLPQSDGGNIKSNKIPKRNLVIERHIRRNLVWLN
jgi:hypothetical protein